MSEKEAPNDEAQTEQETEKSPKQASGPKKHKKVSLMSLEEIEAALAQIGEKMGGFQSSHAMFLLARREYLLKYTPQPLRKAA